MNWSIRNLLTPVITRCHIYGINAIDLEYVLRQVEKKPLVNSRALEVTWTNEWDKKASRFIRLAGEAESKFRRLSASQYYKLATQCYYASYLMNSDCIENKREVYKKLEIYYKKSITFSENSFEELNIKMLENKSLPAYLHLPSDKTSEKPYPCVIVCAGMGSCKEELETLTRPLVERGIAVLACDFPGTGSSLFDHDLKLSGTMLELAFRQIVKVLTAHPLIDENRLGTTGVCMGGGYAYRFAAEYEEVKCCVNLFPLYVNQVAENAIPRWMKSGAWATYQFGTDDVEQFQNGMSCLTEGAVKCDYLLVHSKYDNWMDFDTTKSIFDKTQGKKEEIVIEEELAFQNNEKIMHDMPVGEQMHWVKIYAADWMAEKLRK